MLNKELLICVQVDVGVQILLLSLNVEFNFSVLISTYINKVNKNTDLIGFLRSTNKGL